jgi:hypothetical protein
LPQIHGLAKAVKKFVPAKADEILSEEEQGKIKAYINRQGTQALGRLPQVDRVCPASSGIAKLLACCCWLCRSTDLLLLEVDAEVQEFVATLKDWSLKW